MPANNRFDITLKPESLERLRDAAYWSEGETVSSIFEKGALAYVAQLEAERGSPFPPREGDVRTGRPKKPVTSIQERAKAAAEYLNGLEGWRVRPHVHPDWWVRQPGQVDVVTEATGIVSYAQENGWIE